VNLSSLSFFRSLRKDNQQFAVIGLGRFGRSVCSTLHNFGYQVLATDIDEKRVSEALTEGIVDHALQLDFMSLTTWTQAIANFANHDI
jgi:trk system potassium uptake protein TrkA